jgi:UDP-N-acetylmuramate dehydrogenase
MAVLHNNDFSRFGDRLRLQEPMARHTSWRVGGPAEVWFRPADRAELIEFMQLWDADQPVHWIGLGSNLLVRDGGIAGAVIAVQDALSDIEFLDDGRVQAGAGVACTVLARQCVRRSLGPAEFFAGIPGTVGGALRMNAGAFGGATWDQVKSVEVLNRAGEIRTRDAAEYRAGYRHVDGPADEWFLGAMFGFTENFPTSMERMRELVNERRDKQPLGLPSCGSVFRNPPGDYAARLIEVAGLKGHTIGGAAISTKHANFIINTDSATAADIEALIAHVQNTVQDQFDVALCTEVHVLGEAGGAA